MKEPFFHGKDNVTNLYESQKVWGRTICFCTSLPDSPKNELQQAVGRHSRKPTVFVTRKSSTLPA